MQFFVFLLRRANMRKTIEEINELAIKHHLELDAKSLLENEASSPSEQ
jgi:hypothetical protein